MEFIDSLARLTILVGLDANGDKTVISICTPAELGRATRVITEGYPQTTEIAEYDLTLTAHPRRVSKVNV